MSIKVSYYSTPDQVPLLESLPDGAAPTVAVVIDVLRATTTITKLLEQGAEAVETFEDVGVLLQQAASYKDKLLVGERGGIKIEGFDLGNSPAVISSEQVYGKHVLMSTTNGTRALARVREGVPYVYCAALTNRRAVAHRIIQVLAQMHVQPNETSHLWILGSGGEGKFSLEDTFCAGAVASALEEEKTTVPTSIDFEFEHANDDMVAAMAVWDCYKDSPETCLRKASHGKSLAKIMSKEDADADFQACSALDVSEVVPEQSRPGMLLRSEYG